MTVQELDTLPIGTQVVVKDYHNIELSPYYSNDDNGVNRDFSFEAASPTNSGLTFVQPVMGNLSGKTAKIITHVRSDRVRIQFENDDDDKEQSGLLWCASMLELCSLPQISAKIFQKIMQ